MRQAAGQTAILIYVDNNMASSVIGKPIELFVGVNGYKRWQPERIVQTTLI